MTQKFDTPLFSSDQSIERVLSAGLPVALIFLDGAASAVLDQAVKALAKQEAGNLLVVQMNVKDNPITTRKYNIHGTPALVTIKNSQVQSQAENISGEDVTQHVRYLLGKGPRPAVRQEQRATAGAYAGGAPGGGYSAPAQPSYAPGGDGQGGRPVTVSDATFDQEVMRSPIPVVVDFWAPWCGPCRMVAPTLDKLAREWNGKVKIAKLNVDENPSIASRYRVSGIPTMMVVKGGKILDQWAGALPEPALRARLAGKIG